MDSIIADAMRYSSQQKSPEEKYKDFEPAKVRIAVVGVGGGGTNTVSRLSHMGIKSADTYALNTDANHLRLVEAQHRVLIGASMTKGMGAGGFPEVGRKAAEMSRDKLVDMFSDYELVFVTAGMGGGTGTGAAPVVAEIAKQAGAITVGMVTFPFVLERARLDKADWGIDEMSKSCDTVVIVDNNRLVQFVPNLPMNQAFAVADTLVAKAVKGLADTITLPSLVNIDFADVRTIMGNSGMALISIGEGSGSGRVDAAVKSSLEHPLLDVDYRGSKGALIHVQGGSSLSLGEVTKIGEGITESFHEKANVIWGARVLPDLGDKVVVTTIVTGVSSPQVAGKIEAAPVKKQQSLAIESLSF